MLQDLYRRGTFGDLARLQLQNKTFQPGDPPVRILLVVDSAPTNSIGRNALFLEAMASGEKYKVEYCLVRRPKVATELTFRTHYCRNVRCI